MLRKVIRTREDFDRVTKPKYYPIPSLPIPDGISQAAYDATATRQPITLTCNGDTWTVTPEDARKFADWIDLQHNVAMHTAYTAMRGARGPGAPSIDWFGLLLRLMPAIESGGKLVPTLTALRTAYGIQSLEQALLWIKEQRWASTARLGELGERRRAGNVPDYERAFHERVLLLFPPRAPGRPRKSGK